MVNKLFIAGVQVPEFPLLETKGNGTSVAPLQIGATAVNVGITNVVAFTIIVIVAVVAHNPVVGVNVYVVVAVLFSAGDHVPVTPFVDVVGNGTFADPTHIGFLDTNSGIVLGVTVMVIVAVLVHIPDVGVNVYKVVAALFTAGDQVPINAFVEVVGKAAIVAPEQTAATCVNVGVVFGFTVIVIVDVFAQSPALGVKVYVVVAVLFNAGDHVPVTAFVDVVGNAAIVAPEQTAATCVNVGVVFGDTVMDIVVVFAHNPAVGVNV